jgi:hypothetical protein
MSTIHYHDDADYRSNEHPGNWHGGVGNVSRPLSESGRYLKKFYRILPGSNQHVEKFLELRVDTAGQPPKCHCAALNYYTGNGTETKRIKQLNVCRINVSDPESQAAQKATEAKISAAAEDMMEYYADWTPR